MDSINNKKYPDLKKIFVENKSDKEPESPEEEINKYIFKHPEIDHIKISAIRIASAKKEISKDYGKNTFEHISKQNYKSCLSSHNSECVCCSGVFTSDISDVNALHFPV